MFSSRDIPLAQKGVTWTPTNEGITVTWSDLTVYATPPNRDFFSRGGKTFKRIINNVTGVVKAGTLVALMGPSGAGKSSLMGALANRNAKDVFVDGEIRVNGTPMGNYIQKMSGYMDQQDLFVENLTVREHLHFMARMKLPRSKRKREIQAITEDFLVQLGLTHCAETCIGGGGNEKVLSGGEKKRLAFAAEMLTNPPLLFCDEPTTGLDIYSAQTLVNLMKTMALEGKTIICTIHQPSSELFDIFHQLILLSEGRIAYMGEPVSALQFFEKNGYQCPSNYNPAEFFIRCLALTPGQEERSRRNIKRLCDEFIVSDAAREIDHFVTQERSKCETLTPLQWKLFADDGGGAFWFTKLFLLTYRAFLQVLRDPSVQAVRIIQKLALALMAGLCYVGTVLPNQNGVQSVQGAVFIFVTENTFGAMYAVLALFPMDRPLFMREYKNGLYSPGLYYFSKMAALLPGLILEPVAFSLVAYWLVGLRNTFYAFAMTAFITTLTMNVATACGCFFSNAFSSVSIAMACLIPFDYILMITSGLFIKLDSMPKAISWFKYLSWFMYSNEAMSILQWEGVSNLTCSENPDLPCLHNGVQVLDKYDFAESHFSKDIIAMISLYFIFHALAFSCLYWRAKKNK